ncbi:uncharacterized protein LOC127786893 isoform X3 [Diospyros lotus]|uniref:uncharacterized protein LOC127786893 isoform X3 n=1 Tax=Diospyros lotus TaxID=55363 RepID=UPI00224D1BA0|nr:uncharacterized protein LOC127786893 isoform X3 [Diospyros lotus]
MVYFFLVEWWSQFGTATPNLQKFAIKICSLTCSSSGCERNWSVFEHLHNKKRNRLEQQRLNDLVFVKYNRALRRRFSLRKSIDPISLDEVDESNEWLLGAIDKFGESDDELVHEDHDLTWADVAMSSGVEEANYSTRSKATSTSNLTKGRGIRASTSNAPMDLDEEEEDGEGDDVEEDIGDDSSDDENMDTFDLDDEDDF